MILAFILLHVQDITVEQQEKEAMKDSQSEKLLSETKIQVKIQKKGKKIFQMRSQYSKKSIITSNDC